MKLKKFTALLLSIFVFSTALVCPAQAEGFSYSWDEEAGGPHCKSIFLVNVDTGSVAYSLNPDEPLPMASITKIMTYIVAYETIPNIESTVITVPDSVVTELEGTYSSEAGILPGEELTGLQLLYSMMVPSGNDAALTLAKYVDELHSTGQVGTDVSLEEGESYFVRLMNEKAEELGCENTHFTNPHGLHHQEHYATARDLYKITRHAMTLPNFTEITSTQAYLLPATNKHPEGMTMYSTNKMFSSYEDDGAYFYTYTTGIKTGSLNESGYCIVASATADGYSYVAVCLGSPMLDADGNSTNFHGEMIDARELFRWALVNLRKKTVRAQGEVLSEVKLEYAWKQDTLQLVAAENVSALLPQDVDASSIIITYEKPESVQAPITKGEEIGTATLSYADEVIGTVPMVAAESVARSEMMRVVDQGKSLLGAPWFWIVMAIIFVLIVVYIILVMIYRKKQRQLRKVKRFRDM